VVVVLAFMLVLVLLDVVVEELLVELIMLVLEELVVEDDVLGEVVLDDDVVVVGRVDELVEVVEVIEVDERSVDVDGATVVDVVTDVAEELVAEEEEPVLLVVVVVDEASGEQVHSAVHLAPPAHAPPSHCSPLPGSKMPSPQRLSCATNDSLSFDFLARSVPLRLVQLVSSVPFSFTLPLSPAHDRHTAVTVVPRLVAFSFACTGSQAFPIEIWVPITTGSIGPLESPVTSALPVTR
jgi:hypothetical protein